MHILWIVAAALLGLGLILCVGLFLYAYLSGGLNHGMEPSDAMSELSRRRGDVDAGD